MTENLLEIYRILLEQFGIAGQYTIKYCPPRYPMRDEGYVTVFDEWNNVIVCGLVKDVLHQCREW